MSVGPGQDQVEDVVGTSKPAFLRRVRVRGYKSIAFCDVALEPLTVLVGRNAAGKSNFLDALAFVRDALETSIPQAVKDHGGWEAVRFRQAKPSPVAFEVEVAIPGRVPRWRPGDDPAALSSEPSADGASYPAVYGFVLDTGDHGVPVVSREYLQLPDPAAQAAFAFEIVRGLPPNGPSSNPRANGPVGLCLFAVSAGRPDRLVLSQWGSAPYFQVADGLRFAGYYNFNPNAMRQLQRLLAGGLLERDGSDLPGAIRNLQEIDEATLERVERYLNAVVSEIEGFRVVRYGDFETVRFRLRTGDGPPAEFDAAAMSDGTLRALGCLMAAYQIHLPDGPTVVGIEEPESALHPGALRALAAALDEATLRTQIVLTTHSPDLLDAESVKPQNVRVVEMIDGRTVIGVMDPVGAGIVRDHLSTLGGLEREQQMQPDQDDLERQAELARQGEAAP